MKWIPVYMLLALLMTDQNGWAQQIIYNGQAFNKKGTTLVHTINQVQWSFTRYDSGIIKISCLPQNYLSNLQLSNAVITSPVSTQFIASSGDVPKIQMGNGQVIAIEANGLHIKENNLTILKALNLVERDQFKGFSFQLKDQEQIYGGGERAVAMNRRGHRFQLYNNPSYGYSMGADHLNFSLPFFISSQGYGIFFDNPSKGYADIGKKDAALFEAGFVSGALSFYIIPGKNMHEIVNKYSLLTGRQSIPARWVFGNIMSRFGYRSEAQVMRTVAAMKADHFPVDAVVLDLFWFGDSIQHTLGNLDWVNRERWPSPENMIAQLKAQQINTVLITEPFLIQQTKNYNAGEKYLATDSMGRPYILKDFYFGKGGLIDIFRTDAQNWFWQHYQKQMLKGVAGWWGDLGEPEKHPSDLFHQWQTGNTNQRVGADAIHNLYGHYWSKLLYEKYSKEYKDTRLFHLNRSGFAGSARYSVFPWTGDVSRSWGGFQAQLPLLLGMSIGGMPYIHSDAGGFAGGEMDPELYTRWIQFACFTPVLRPHGTALEDLDPAVANIPSEPVFWPDPYKSIVRKYMNLRYQLLPYNYDLAWQHTSTGKPLMRPMNYYHFADSNLTKAEGQYMWGDAILVAPVIEKAATHKLVYFPKGYWYTFNSNETINGGKWDSVKVDINDIPLFVKAGSFLPLFHKTIENTSKYKSDTLRLTYYPDTASSVSTLYNDDGSTHNSWKKNKYEMLTFKATVIKNEIILQVQSNKGSYTGRPHRRFLMMTIPGLKKMPGSIKVNGLKVKVQERFGEEGVKRIVPYAIWDAVNQILHIHADAGNADTHIAIVQ